MEALTILVLHEVSNAFYEWGFSSTTLVYNINYAGCWFNEHEKY